MRWTEWQLLAEGPRWYDTPGYTGPSLYELGIALPGRIPIVTYLGETGNERQRMAAYGAHGSHLSDAISWHLRRGWFLIYRAIAFPSKHAARAAQDRRLWRFAYPWNIQLN